MTRHAIQRSIFLLVATDAKSHRMIHFAFCDRLLPHIAMTDRTIDSRPDMRRVIESHVRGWLKTIDALPRNVFAPRAVGGELLNLWIARSNHLVAGHAEVDVRDSRVRALIDADVAIGALHTVGEVHFVRISNGLDGLRAKVKKFPDGIGNGGVRRGENVRVLQLGSLGGQDPSPQHPSQQDHADYYGDARIMAQAKRRAKNTPSL